MINSADLKSFLVTAQHLHLTKAAQALGMSQPALSHCIKRLELELQNDLFLRRKSGLILTEAGQYLLLHGNKVLEEMNQIENFLISGKLSLNRTLKLGLHSAVAAYLLPAFYKLQSEIKLSMNFGLSREMTSMVQTGTLDCAVAINPHPHPNLIVTALGEDNFTLWSTKKINKAKRLFFDPDLQQSQHLLRQIERKGIHYDSYEEIKNLDIIARLLLDGAGDAFLPARVVHNFEKWEKSVIDRSVEIKSFKDRICFVYSEENPYKVELVKLKQTMIKALQ